MSKNIVEEEVDRFAVPLKEDTMLPKESCISKVTAEDISPALRTCEAEVNPT